jgi:hypothetical protein
MIMNPGKLTDYVQRSGRIAEADLDKLRFELNKRLYYYGGQFRRPPEGAKRFPDYRNIARTIRRLFVDSAAMLRRRTRADIQSNAYSSVNREIEKLGYSVSLPPWTGATGVLSASTRRALNRLDRFFRQAAFWELQSQELFSITVQVESGLLDYYSTLQGLVVPFDVRYYENVSIRLFRELAKPSFVFLHGLPGRYNSIDDNRADYLIVWGEAIKRHYVQAGVDSDKIIVSGHPDLSGRQVTITRNATDDVLVVTKSMPGAQPISGETIVPDRSDSILYLYLIEDALKRRGVHRARFRPHPSENGAWYQRYLDPQFYNLDTSPLGESLKEATLVVGPTSTVLLNALVSGVNYLVFEPLRNGLDLLGYPIVPPFDGSDACLPVAHDIDSFDELLRKRAQVDQRIAQDYLNDSFDLSAIKRIIGQ